MFMPPTPPMAFPPGVTPTMPQSSGTGPQDFLRLISMATGGMKPQQGAGAGGSDFAGLIPLLMGKAKPGGLLGMLMNGGGQQQQQPQLPMNIGPAFGQPVQPGQTPATAPFGLGVNGIY